MKQIYRDVMIDNVILKNDENSLVFLFYDDLGNTLQNIECINTMCINFSNSLPNNEELFPCFVLSVEVEPIEPENLYKHFSSLNYGFSLNGELVLPVSNEYWHLKIEGGPIYFELIASSIRLL